MSLLKKKPSPTAKPEIKYENEYRKELCTQAELAQDIIKEHIRGGKITFDKLHLDPKGIRTVYIVAQSGNSALALWAEKAFETVCCTFTKALSTESFKQSLPPTDRHTLTIFIGKDIPQEAKECQGKTLLLTGSAAPKSHALCTHYESTLQVADFTLSYLLLSMLAVYIARKKGLLTELYYKLVIEAFAELRAALNNIMKNEQFLIRLSEELKPDHLILTGRGEDYPCAVYISRLFSTAYGNDIRAVNLENIGDINDKRNLIALASSDRQYSLLPSLDYSFKIAPLGCDDSIKNLCYQGMLPLFNPLLSCVTAQVIAYHIIYGTKGEQKTEA